MGLDITAVSKVKFIEELPSGEAEHKYYAVLCDACDLAGIIEQSRLYQFVYPNPQFFESRMAPYPTPARGKVAVYKVLGTDCSFRAGSYTSYNDWREMLAKMVTDEPIETIWERDPRKRCSIPFFELLHFSDCEGILGRRVARKLKRDFIAWREDAKEIGGEFWELYGRWGAATEIAADRGMILFH